MKPDSDKSSLASGRSRHGASSPYSTQKDKDPALSAATLALVRKGLAASAAGKTAYHGTFKHHVKPRKRTPKTAKN